MFKKKHTLNYLQDKMQPLVSILLPYYNDEKFLRKSIEAVLSSTYHNFELILLNHATTDSCRKIAHSYKDPRIKHIDMDMNYGAGGGILFSAFFEKAQGKYIKPICADDELLPDGLEKLVLYMENNPHISFAFGKPQYINEMSERLNIVFFEQFGFNIQNDNVDELLLYKNYRGHLPWPASIFRKEDLNLIDFDKVLIMEFDMSIYLQLLLQEKNVGFLDDYVVRYRLHENQLSKDKKGHNIYNINLLEIPLFLQMFYKLESVKLLKQVFSDCPLVKKLSRKDKKFIPFIIAYDFSYSDDFYKKIVGYFKLYEILNDSALSQEIKLKFGYTVKDFRERYKNYPFLLQMNVSPQKQEQAVQKKYSKFFSIHKFKNKKIIYFLGFKITVRL